jgi:hypothetical protein
VIAWKIDNPKVENDKTGIRKYTYLGLLSAQPDGSIKTAINIRIIGIPGYFEHVTS